MHEGLDLYSHWMSLRAVNNVNKFKPGNCASRLHTCMIDELAFKLKFPKLTSRLSLKASTQSSFNAEQ